MFTKRQTYQREHTELVRCIQQVHSKVVDVRVQDILSHSVGFENEKVELD